MARPGSLPLDCARCGRLLPDAVSGALGAGAERAVGAHLAACPACRERAGVVRDALTAPPGPVPPALRADLLALYRGWRGRRPPG